MRQISEVTHCGVRSLGTLDFDHFSGACSNVDNREIYLCFDCHFCKKQCRSAVDPLKKFVKIGLSNFEHGFTRTAASPSKY